MRKPEKPAKTMTKAVRVLPTDQVMIPTQCGFCKKQFPSPTHAQWHLEEEHPDAYA